MRILVNAPSQWPIRRLGEMSPCSLGSMVRGSDPENVHGIVFRGFDFSIDHVETSAPLMVDTFDNFLFKTSESFAGDRTHTPTRVQTMGKTR